MFVRDLKECKEFRSGDNAAFRELFNPLKDELKLNYSLGRAVVKPERSTKKHKLKSSEVYFILKGKGVMFIDGEERKVREGEAIYIPPESIQRIKNNGSTDLVFLCIVEPAWKKEDEEVVE
ncbi:MAG: cupin domain-containing protein [archaeon]|nr:cupin domain-containing protein [Candidatus Micrarchaeota archaeon]